ncbi:MAG TPA: hypothetical protein VFZ26_18885 [Gemmatimonadales bacterium]
MLETLLLIAAVQAAGSPAVSPPPAVLRIEVGVTPAGEASDRWLAMIRRRVSPDRYAAIAPIRKPLSAEERAWADLIVSRRDGWERDIPALAALFEPVPPPAEAVIVIGNRGAEDAFTHDPITIGFDLSALQRVYGDAASPANPARMDRLFRHEYVHLMQKAWLAVHPYRMDSPVGAALAEIWGEGMGTWFSMSERWRGGASEAAAGALARLAPRFADRLSALACASSAEADSLTADLSNGAFGQKWGALPAGLWLEEEVSREGTRAPLRRLVLEGPDGVWALAERHLPDSLWRRASRARVGCPAPATPGGPL